MEKKKIKIKFQNGLLFESGIADILRELLADFEFENSEHPDFIIFGPYGNDLPPPGDYVRIGYYCENIKPDMSLCEWAFGVPREEDVMHPHYKRIQWHGLNPQILVKPADYDAGKISASKTKFCNFLYSHKVPYREAFFARLSKYKKVDAPGKSMNNMPSVDSLYAGDKWLIKRQFLSEYKFTIAFENDVFPGYQTEKLYDAMQANSIPIYCGDPFIGDIFNTRSFINVNEYLPRRNAGLINRLEKWGQMDFEDIRPQYLYGPKYRVKRKVKSLIRTSRAKIQCAEKDFDRVIDQIIALDSDPKLYQQYLEQPWFTNNAVPESSLSTKRWTEIFNSR